MKIEQKKLVIIGSAASGIGAAKLALANKALVALYDQKSWDQYTTEEQQDLKVLEQAGVKLLLGINMIQEVTNYELIILSPGVPRDLDFIEEAKKNKISIIGEFEFAFQYCKANLVAITGTNGKTTTTSLVGDIVKDYIPHTYVVGNIGRPFSEDVMMIEKEDAVIAELSSFQLESVSQFRPLISSVLNIEPDHLDRHKTMENYINIKKRIFENQKADDFLILNYDDPNCLLMAQDAKAKIIWFSSTQKLTLGTYIDNDYIVNKTAAGDVEIICHTNELQIPGQHNVENALAAVAITRVMGIPLAVIQKRIKLFQAVPHRIEYIGSKKEIDFFNDSKATNPDAAIKGLLAMSSKVRLIAGGLDKQANFDSWIELFPGRVECVYIIGQTKDQLLDSLDRHKFNNYKVFASLEEAVNQAYEDGQKGESILLSPGCASWDMFKDYEVRGNLFKEIFQSLEE